MQNQDTIMQKKAVNKIQNTSYPNLSKLHARISNKHIHLQIWPSSEISKNVLVIWDTSCVQEESGLHYSTTSSSPIITSMMQYGQDEDVWDLNKMMRAIFIPETDGF